MIKVKKPKLAIFVNHPQCSVQSAHGLIRALYDQFDIDCIGVRSLNEKNLRKYDMLAIPGGVGDSDTWHELIEPHQNAILNEIARGKKYLGICMGAYWAGPEYLNLLNGVKTIQYIKTENSDIKRSFGTIAEITWMRRKEKVYFYDGCSFEDDGGKYKVYARYANNMPAAIIQGNVGLIGPHLESDIYWYDKPFMKPHWHRYRHHKLLSKFVKKLLEPG